MNQGNTIERHRFAITCVFFYKELTRTYYERLSLTNVADSCHTSLRIWELNFLEAECEARKAGWQRIAAFFQNERDKLTASTLTYG